MSLSDKTTNLLLKEAGLTTSCIEQGLTSLRKASFQYKSSYYQAFFLLTIGIERLLKIIIITIYRVEKEKLPSNNDLKNYGHDIKELFQKVTKHLRPNDTFLLDDELNRKILDFLTEYAKISRYYNLDSLTGIEKTNDPLHKWNEIRVIIENRHGKPREFPFDPRLLNSLNNNVLIRMTNEQGQQINTGSSYLLELTNVDKIQGYSVYYVYQLISYLIGILNELSYKKHLLPYFNEFFVLFTPPLDRKDIIKRKNWNYSITSR